MVRITKVSAKCVALTALSQLMLLLCNLTTAHSIYLSLHTSVRAGVAQSVQWLSSGLDNRGMGVGFPGGARVYFFQHPHRLYSLIIPVFEEQWD